MNPLERLLIQAQHRRVKLEIETCRHLNQLFGSPDQTFSAIHIAGSNGKGSVATKIAASLQAARWRVGLYTSPHLKTYRERISVNGTWIQEAEVEALLNELYSLADQEGVSLSFFETMTLLAFAHFRNKKVDYAVVEVGLGGKLDATNILHPIQSIITSISLEHTQILGQTVEAIAQEKGGIIKPFIPVIVGPHVPKQILQKIAKEKKAPLYSVEGTYSTVEEENRAIAKLALEHLGIRKEAILEGLGATLPCRSELILPNVIFDVAHNPDALLRLFQELRSRFPGRPFHVAFAFSKEKEFSPSFSILTKEADALFYVVHPHERLLSYEECLALIEQTKGVSPLLPLEPKHLKEAVEKDNPPLWIITGSFFIMDPCRQALAPILPLSA